MTTDTVDGEIGPRATLAATIADLYGTFRRYKLHHPVTGCPCCTSAEDDRRVQSKPLHHLEPADLERFAIKAFTTLGSENDLKHFLPRLLELPARDGTVGGADLEIVLGKLDYGHWGGWPEPERRALRAYLSALWLHVTFTFPSTPDAGTCLCGIGGAEDDLRPYLDAWRRSDSVAAARHLAALVGRNLKRLLKAGQLANAFWAFRQEQMRQVVDWLIEPATTARLEQAFYGCDDPAVACELSLAVDQLEWVRRQRHATAGPA
jgi:hypothetical protein